MVLLSFGKSSVPLFRIQSFDSVLLRYGGAVSGGYVRGVPSLRHASAGSQRPFLGGVSG